MHWFFLLPGIDFDSFDGYSYGYLAQFLLVPSVSFVLVTCFYFIVPERAESLISKQLYNKAVQCFKRVAKINKHTRGSANHFYLFQTPHLRRHTSILLFSIQLVTNILLAIILLIRLLITSNRIVITLCHDAGIGHLTFYNVQPECHHFSTAFFVSDRFTRSYREQDPSVSLSHALESY